MPKSFVAVIAYLSPDERKAAKQAAYANQESMSTMIGRLLRAEIARLDRKARAKTEQAK